MSEDYTYEEEIIERDEYIGDGIVVPKQYIYLGDGIYVEYRPEIVSSEEGQNSNSDNTLQRWNQKDHKWSEDGYYYTE